MIDEILVKNTVIELLKDASTKLPQDVKNALQKAYEIEEGPSKSQLEAILKNIKMAEKSSTRFARIRASTFLLVLGT